MQLLYAQYNRENITKMAIKNYDYSCGRVITYITIGSKRIELLHSVSSDIHKMYVYIPDIDLVMIEKESYLLWSHERLIRLFVDNVERYIRTMDVCHGLNLLQKTEEVIDDEVIDYS